MKNLLAGLALLLSCSAHSAVGPQINGNQINAQTAISIATLTVTGTAGITANSATNVIGPLSTNANGAYPNGDVTSDLGTSGNRWRNYFGASSVTASGFFGNGSALTGVTATTNANLTGPVTSVGNATTIVGPVPTAAVDLSTVTTALALKAPLASPTFTGTLTAPIASFTSTVSALGSLSASSDGTAVTSTGTVTIVASLANLRPAIAIRQHSNQAYGFNIEYEDVIAGNLLVRPVVNNVTGSTAIAVNRADSAVMLKGASDGSAASAGYYGEFVSTFPAVSVTGWATTGNSTSIATMTLTAGTWDIYGAVSFLMGGTSAFTAVYGCISTTANAEDSRNNMNYDYIAAAIPVNQRIMVRMGPRRVNISGSTTYYLTAGGAYTVLGGATYEVYSGMTATRVR